MCVLLVGTWQRDLSTWRQVEKRFPRPIPGLEADSVATGFTRRKQVHAQLTVIGWFCCKVWLGNLNVDAYMLSAVYAASNICN